MNAKLKPKIDIKAIIAKGGGAIELAKTLGLDRRNVYSWIKNGQVPPHWCVELERITGYSCEDMQPNVFKERHEHKKAPSA